jgi:hypothetical protein
MLRLIEAHCLLREPAISLRERDREHIQAHCLLREPAISLKNPCISCSHTNAAPTISFKHRVPAALRQPSHSNILIVHLKMQEQAEKDEERADRIKEFEEQVAGARLECTHLAAARTEEQEAKEARHQAALQAAQEECLLLQQKVADVTEEVEEERRLGKQLHCSLEEERELAKMRSRRLRSGIRSVQAQVCAFASLRECACLGLLLGSSI